MSRRTFLLLAVILLAGLVIVWTRSERGAGVEKAPVSAAVERVLGPRATPATGEATVEGARSAGPAANWDVVDRCLELNGGVPATGPFTEENLLSILQSKWGKVSRRGQDWRNVHLRASDGEETRVRLVSEPNADGVDVPRLQVFGVDAEGLPIPVKIPESHATRPSRETVDSYLRRGDVVYEETSTTYLFSRGEVARVISEGPSVRDLELVAGESRRLLKCQTPPGTSLTRCECI